MVIGWTADDPAPGSGVEQIVLWVKPPGGDWQDSGQSQSTDAFEYTPEDGDGRTQYSTQPPQLTLALSEASPHAHVDGPAVYYSPASGAFSVTAPLAPPGT